MKKNWNPKILLAKSLGETLFWAKKCYYDGHYHHLKFGISDEVYDKFEKELEKMCPGHPVLNCVGSPDFDILPGMVAMRLLIEPKETVDGEDLL